MTPFLARLPFQFAAAQHLPVTASQLCRQSTRLSILNAYPCRQLVLLATFYAHSPVSGVGHSSSWSLYLYPQGLLLNFIEHSLSAQFQLALQGHPSLWLCLGKLHGTVADEFRIQSAIGSMIDVFKEDAVQCGTHLHTFVIQVHFYVYLGAERESCAQQSRQCSRNPFAHNR